MTSPVFALLGKRSKHSQIFSQTQTAGMAEEALAKAGLHFDELNKIRVLEPEVAQQTGELKEECKDFLDSRWS